MRPFIGITSSAEDDGQPVVRPHYVAAVHAAGGLPVPLPFLADEADAAAVLERLAGVVLSGSDDLDSALWSEPLHPRAKLMHPARQRTELLLCRALLERELPVLAICGGMQTLAVAAGGALHQHIPDVFDGSIDHAAGTEGARHGLALEAGTQLARLLGEGSPLAVNSAHHQSISRLPADFRPVAHSGDGVLEAYEGAGPGFRLGVQWHPERMPEEPGQRRLFAALVSAAAG